MSRLKLSGALLVIAIISCIYFFSQSVGFFYTQKPFPTQTFITYDRSIPGIGITNTLGGTYPTVSIDPAAPLKEITLSRNEKPWITLYTSNKVVSYVGPSCGPMKEYSSLTGVNTKNQNVFTIPELLFKLYNDDGIVVNGSDLNFSRQWGYSNGVWHSISICFTSNEEMNKYEQNLQNLFDYGIGFGISYYGNLSSSSLQVINYQIAKTKPTLFWNQNVWVWSLPIEVDGIRYTPKLTTFVNPKSFIFIPPGYKTFWSW